MPLVSPLSEPAQIERVHESGLYRLTATAVSDNIGVEDEMCIRDSNESAAKILAEYKGRVETRMEDVYKRQVPSL